MSKKQIGTAEVFKGAVLRVYKNRNFTRSAGRQYLPAFELDFDSTQFEKIGLDVRVTANEVLYDPKLRELSPSFKLVQYKNALVQKIESVRQTLLNVPKTSSQIVDESYKAALVAKGFANLTEAELDYIENELVARNREGETIESLFNVWVAKVQQNKANIVAGYLNQIQDLLKQADATIESLQAQSDSLFQELFQAVA
jgi:hypothetical protein